jgi:hypothetical protein
MYMSETSLLWPILASDEFVMCLRGEGPKVRIVRAVETNLRNDWSVWSVWVEWPLESLGLKPNPRNGVSGDVVKGRDGMACS